jgi:RNA polymerase sigma factor (TIGR02999 family)
MDAMTEVLAAVERGEPGAAGRLLPLVYADLRRLAAARLARESPGQTLDATALVHEAYLRVAGGDPDRPWDGRGHFFAAAAEAMRRILVEAARRKRRLKRGGGRGRDALPESRLAAPALGPDPEDLLALDEALARLERLDPIKARLVELRYFSGLSVPRAAEALGLSAATAERYWAYARAWLKVELGGPEAASGGGRP